LEPTPEEDHGVFSKIIKLKNMKNKPLNFPTRAPKGLDKEKTKEETKKNLKKLDELQNVLYAESKYSVLIVLQGLDAAGKDGAIKNIFTGVNPQGCSVKPFKAPSSEELSYDFLWRVHKNAPAKGMIQIFNRSHYEDVLVPRIEKWVDEKEIKRRYDAINNFEQLLERHNNTIIIKFFLNISKEKQQEKFEERLSNPSKNWKYNVNDQKAAANYDKYLDAYKDIIKKCSPEIPWTVVPCDQNWYKEHLIAKTIVERLKKLDMKYPKAVK
jgi:PPK2 family polyphosphate:nucleotide phosphotransferase